jgi:hypothetical protein
MATNVLRMQTSSWIVTKSAARLTFDDLKKLPDDGGPLTRLNLLTLDIASAIFGSYCATIEEGCVQIFDNVSQREHGFFEL